MIILVLTLGLFSFCLPLVALLTRKGRRLSQNQFEKRKLLIDNLLALKLTGAWLMQFLAFLGVFHYPHYIARWAWPLHEGASPAYLEWQAWALLMTVFVLQAVAMWLGRSQGYQNAFFLNPTNWSDPKPEETKKTEMRL